MPDRNETARIEAFSDGVFAIAITLLILEIKVPHHAHTEGDLYKELLNLWPSYFAFLTSFMTIGIMWMNHHRFFTLIGRSNHLLLLLNCLLLLTVTFVPFPTALLAEYIGKQGERTAAMFYSGTFVVIAIAFNGLWLYASRGGRLLYAEVAMQQETVRKQTGQYLYGPFSYAIAFAVAWVSVPASLAINFLLAAFFALPPQRALMFKQRHGHRKLDV